HDVLGGRAPMHVAPGVTALLGELVHDTDDGVADEGGLRLLLCDVDLARTRKPTDRGSGVLRDYADACLGGRERHLDLDVACDQRLVAECRTHRRRAEG